jgi:hypothetical protein
MAEMDRAAELTIATGLVGYALTMELLTTLNTQGFLTGDQLRDIMDSALSNLETVDAEEGHELYWLARKLLGHHLTGVRNEVDPELGPDVSDP